MTHRCFDQNRRDDTDSGCLPAVGSSNTWTPTGSMTNARTHHTATLLANGEVLVAGGGNTTILPSAELYNRIVRDKGNRFAQSLPCRDSGQQRSDCRLRGKLHVRRGNPAYDWSDSRTCLVHLAPCAGSLHRAPRSGSDAGGTGSRSSHGGARPRFPGAAHCGG